MPFAPYDKAMFMRAFSAVAELLVVYWTKCKKASVAFKFVGVNSSQLQHLRRISGKKVCQTFIDISDLDDVKHVD